VPAGIGKLEQACAGYAAYLDSGKDASCAHLLATPGASSIFEGAE
jgi:hypothetical protein